MTETVVEPQASPLLALPGAVPATGLDAGVAWHYGDPVREQRMLAAGTGRVDLSHRGVLRVEGPDRLSWLNSLSTQALTGLPPWTSSESLILSPHGHVEHAMHLVDDGTATWITVEPGTAGALAEYLRRMQFMLRVQVDDVTPGWAVIGEPVRGEGAAGGPVTWSDPWPGVVPGGVAYGPVQGHPDRSWREVLVPRSSLSQPGSSDGEWAGTWAAEALRVENWRPRMGFETDHRTIPHEVDWLRTAVHLAKGCYRGQETVARVHNLGRPPRRLVLLHLDGSGHLLPEAASELHLASDPGGRALGRVTTAARHHELGPVALAVVKRSVPVDATLLADGIAAAQEVVVQP